MRYPVERPVVILVGPTAVGKTALALALAGELQAEIISADSRLFYRGMDIGTAKPTPQELRSVPHHLIDIAEPDQTYSLALFQREALRIIADVQARGKLPPPVWGQVVGRFQDPAGDDYPALTKGLSIKTAERVDVFAVYGGTVIFAGSMRGYGKLVIIEHDRQYHTVTARLGEVAVREGDAVKQGQVIGATAAVSERGLYFEIRRGAMAEDPLRWLQPGSLAQP